MILDQLILHDFGVYGGRQNIELTPVPRRPVILFGALNGGGKTTLLDAFQLCLYGSAAQLSNRNGHSYDEYLKRSIHNAVGRTGASIELAFRHRVNGVEQGFRLHRSWGANRSGVREQFEVIRDGRFDRLATEHWASQVEEFIPARIAHLFLFDGEKVESYADLETAPALVATAVQNLLGLDIVERLGADLASLERRRRGTVSSPAEQNQLKHLQEEIRSLEAARLFMAQARAASGNALDRARRESDALEDQYRREGGALYEERASKAATFTAVERELEAVKRGLRELVAGSTPLILVSRLLRAVQKRDADEEMARRSAETILVLLAEHEALLSHPTITSLPRNQQERLSKAMAERRRLREAETNGPIVLKLESAARAGLFALNTSELSNIQKDVMARLADATDAQRRLEELKSEIAAIPAHEMIAGLEGQRAAIRKALQAAETDFVEKSTELARLESEINVLKQSEKRILSEQTISRFAQEDTIRIMRHSERVRDTLVRFREAVVVRHVERIQALVLDSFKQLARKQRLVGDLKIDPVTFRLDLKGGNGKSLSAERLSAGERQLLAIAILWGLARAAGRPLPTVIDTPLGRLDSEHRDHLVRRYFPHASHQVLLLSTDEEITGRHYEALKPAIGREYRLRFDEADARTVVEEGYFEEEFRGH